MSGSARCGSESSYRRHRAQRTVPCRLCCDAHAVHMANWRARSRVTAALDPILYQAARLGIVPAEVLAPGDRARLVSELVGRCWSDVEVAALTRMSTYTAARIRTDLGLPAARRTHEGRAA